MENLNKLLPLKDGMFFIRIKIDKLSDKGDITNFIKVINNRRINGMNPLVFKLVAESNDVMAYHLDFNDDLLFSFVSSEVFDIASKEEYLGYVNDVEAEDEKAPVLDLVIFPVPEEYRKEIKDKEILQNKLLEDLGHVNLFDESAPPIWVCYKYGTERIPRECSIFRGKGNICCKIEDIEQQPNYKFVYNQLSESDNVFIKEDGEYTIGVYFEGKKIGNIEARNVPAVALCIPKEGCEIKISEKKEDEYRMYVNVPATFIRIDDYNLERKYGPFTFEVKIVKREPSWQEYRFKVPRDKFKQIFYYEDPRAKKYSKEELSAQPLPDISGLNCKEDIGTFAVDFLKYIRLLGIIKTVDVNYFPYKKCATIDFNDAEENFSFEDHRNEIEDYLNYCNAKILSYKFEYRGISVKFNL